MSLFRVDSEHHINGPHQATSVAEHGAQLSDAEAAMIMVHGRGATARSMFPLAEEFAQPTFHYRAIQAQKNTWYPYSFLSPREQNQPGIKSGLQSIYDQIEIIEKAGISKGKIIILGFSQGACLASEYVARHPQKFGGLVALSGGLIGDEIEKDSYQGSLEDTEIFLGCSDVDPHIPKERVDLTEQVLKSLEGNVTKKIYKNMAHTVNRDEINQIRKIMANLLQ